MAQVNMDVKVLNVVKTTAQWAAETSIISKGFLCVEFTTDNTVLVKIGDGTKTYADLPYVSDGSFVISDYYTKTETDEAISDAITGIGKVLKIKGVKATVAELPATDNEVGDLWFVGTATEESTDSFSEYIWTDAGAWEFLGRVQTEVDLSGYATTTYVTNEIKKVTDSIDAIDERVTAIEGDYVKNTDTLVLNCTL